MQFFICITVLKLLIVKICKISLFYDKWAIEDTGFFRLVRSDIKKSKF